MKYGYLSTTVVKTKKDYNEGDRKKIKKNYNAKKILVCGIGADAYNIIFVCETTEEIWGCLQTTYEGTHRVKEPKVDMLTTPYKTFVMKEEEPYLRWTQGTPFITNELRCLGEPIPISKQVFKILKVLPKSWET